MHVHGLHSELCWLDCLSTAAGHLRRLLVSLHDDVLVELVSPRRGRPTSLLPIQYVLLGFAVSSSDISQSVRLYLELLAGLSHLPFCTWMAHLDIQDGDGK